MRAMLLRIAILIALTGVWVLLWGNYSAANAVSGMAVAFTITLLLPMPPVPVQGRVHPLSVLRLAVRVAWYLVVSSVQVSWLAIKPGPPPPSGVLRAQVSIKSDLVLVFAVNILTMIPGSIVLEIDQLRRVLYCHVIDVGSARAIDRFYRQVAEVERLVVAAYERDEDWQPVEEVA
ncbi:Na+/H+ antiporter subunit E [Mycobacterium branderi]|uniref:Cation antiporter subunit n=1 Tax=Mycobacterium branderi TaxID=43348 RepID=A0A7I7W323_9MYCO|nr:Na+/H+ antiporter subunit E [Mycobacterium branderi]MCV7236155.1 Na+/H+ antiporter subunit E [Mycobacterium branderi]ORA32037.1 Na+/H+ antiporter subunit E [Mycobacterium branderi]BBZ10813.1 putative cation antiporter subunit [Mycobacterium branderi]